jgi:hypothetical protein
LGGYVRGDRGEEGLVVGSKALSCSIPLGEVVGCKGKLCATLCGHGDGLLKGEGLATKAVEPVAALLAVVLPKNVRCLLVSGGLGLVELRKARLSVVQLGQGDGAVCRLGPTSSSSKHGRATEGNLWLSLTLRRRKAGSMGEVRDGVFDALPKRTGAQMGVAKLEGPNLGLKRGGIGGVVEHRQGEGPDTRTPWRLPRGL